VTTTMMTTGKFWWKANFTSHSQ